LGGAGRRIGPGAWRGPGASESPRTNVPGALRAFGACFDHRRAGPLSGDSAVGSSGPPGGPPRGVAALRHSTPTRGRAEPFRERAPPLGQGQRGAVTLRTTVSLNGSGFEPADARSYLGGSGERSAAGSCCARGPSAAPAPFDTPDEVLATQFRPLLNADQPPPPCLDANDRARLNGPRTPRPKGVRFPPAEGVSFSRRRHERASLVAGLMAEFARLARPSPVGLNRWVFAKPPDQGPSQHPHDRGRRRLTSRPRHALVAPPSKPEGACARNHRRALRHGG
jgi:hypothetical protein